MVYTGAMEDTQVRWPTFTFKLDAHLRARLEEEAKREQRSIGALIQRVLGQLEPFDFDASMLIEVWRRQQSLTGSDPEPERAPPRRRSPRG